MLRCEVCGRTPDVNLGWIAHLFWWRCPCGNLTNTLRHGLGVFLAVLAAREKGRRP